MSKHPQWEKPPHWKKDSLEPGEYAMKLVEKYPCSIPGWGDSDAMSPMGAGWYGLTRLRFRDDSPLVTEFQVREAYPCKEQCLNTWHTRGEVYAWPAGMCEVVPATAVEEEEVELARMIVDFSNLELGVWATADYEPQRTVAMHRPESVDSSHAGSQRDGHQPTEVDYDKSGSSSSSDASMSELSRVVSSAA